MCVRRAGKGNGGKAVPELNMEILRTGSVYPNIYTPEPLNMCGPNIQWVWLPPVYNLQACFLAIFWSDKAIYL
jgi:hypothetical protein